MANGNLSNKLYPLQKVTRSTKEIAVSGCSLADIPVHEICGMLSSRDFEALDKNGVKTVRDLFGQMDAPKCYVSDRMNRALEHAVLPAEMRLRSKLHNECPDALDMLVEGLSELLQAYTIDPSRAYVCVVNRDGQTKVYSVTCTYMPEEIFAYEGEDAMDVWLAIRLASELAASRCMVKFAAGEQSFCAFLRMAA